ncbi:hypothetical protein DSCO28_71910 [Desulfosarcina ovata subsp. sediminis]|uniref:Uncharacterized protein n=1 Tax=Desulfosarcina ovata subsp. sediminis TaxID=885957 RepID=A0A5K8A205_9BACT|nr:hypothetical protein [Desulfosarcina ovata]BBO86625.1 hypothetical protein DSCO28_71910 [Desulfosarcina ovata subsp. sediminis]
MPSSDRIRIMYTGCPVEALEKAIAQHGEQHAYLLIPTGCDWLVTGKQPRRQTRRPVERRNGSGSFLGVGLMRLRSAR